MNRLTEIGNEKYILPLLEGLSCFIATHDWLHENLLHRNDVIYCSHCGMFLQAFQFELQQKYITGHLASNNAQGHKLLLRIVLSAHQ